MKLNIYRFTMSTNYWNSYCSCCNTNCFVV